MTAREIHYERRLRPRQEAKLELNFSYRAGDRTFFGTGRMTNFNNEELCFESDQPLPRNAQLEVVIAWPALLQGALPLEMIVRGNSVGQRGMAIVIRADSFEFRTCGRASFHSAPTRGELFSALT